MLMKFNNITTVAIITEIPATRIPCFINHPGTMIMIDDNMRKMLSKKLIGKKKIIDQTYRFWIKNSSFATNFFDTRSESYKSFLPN